MSVGAQPTESVEKLFKIVKLDDRFGRFKSGEDKAVLIDEGAKIYQARAAQIKAK